MCLQIENPIRAGGWDQGLCFPETVSLCTTYERSCTLYLTLNRVLVHGSPVRAAPEVD